jgi:hypothetical protein
MHRFTGFPRFILPFAAGFRNAFSCHLLIINGQPTFPLTGSAGTTNALLTFMLMKSTIARARLARQDYH